jgi:hypothetical protein
MRTAVLAELEGSPEATQEVLRYCENRFDLEKVPAAPVFPMTDEPHVTFWRSHIGRHGTDAFAALRARLPQLCIPIREGMSKTPAYGDVMRRGKPFHEEAFGGKLTLERPAQIELVIREHPAGALPVFITPHRPDFETLIRALAFRHEPGPTNASVNAHMISGFLNWERVREYQDSWIAKHSVAGMVHWNEEMQRVATAEKWRFYDRLIVVCEQPYSSLTAKQLGLDMEEGQWLRTSTSLRLEHEFMHYATKRLYDYMSLNLFDETICDWAGMTAALGRFEGRLFLHFLGLEDWPRVRPGGRVYNYRSELSEEAFSLLCRLIIRVAEGLEKISRAKYVEQERSRFLVALTRLTLELLAAEDRQDFFQRSYEEAGQLLMVPR